LVNIPAIGVTPEGKYHVRNCDLNAPHLVNERAERAECWSTLESKVVMIKDGKSVLEATPMLEIIGALQKQVAKMIPRIPYLSGEALEKHRALKESLAAHTFA
jgi:hypothetical protein